MTVAIKGYPQLVRDTIKMFALWPAIDDATLLRFAKDAHQIEMNPVDIASLRDTMGVGNPKFRLIGRKICEWVVCQQLAAMGYNGRTPEKLVAACTGAIGQMVQGTVSPLLIGEWVQDYYEELAAYSHQPMRYRLLAGEKAVELQELMQCTSLPKISLRG